MRWLTVYKYLCLLIYFYSLNTAVFQYFWPHKSLHVMRSAPYNPPSPTLTSIATSATKLILKYPKLSVRAIHQRIRFRCYRFQPLFNPFSTPFLPPSLIHFAVDWHSCFIGIGYIVKRNFMDYLI
jgi:hypothetical protein